MDEDANTNTHANDVAVGDAAVNAHSAAPMDADALDRDTSEVVGLQPAQDATEQIAEDQPIHVPIGT